MEKHRADRLITVYRDRIFGFALSKTGNISQAEELASDIVCEVYKAFLSREDIANPDGYVYRIACNMYAKFIHRRASGRNYEDISEMTLPCCDEAFEKLENEETYARLRREIGCLSQRQRTVIFLYYYEKKTVSEISRALKISPGTVKWHLSDARCSLEGELTMEKIKDELAVNPIKFIDMGHNGYTGDKGDTADMFDTRLKQNIAFSCYFTPLTVREISRKLAVPASYVADELKILVEYGYIDRLDNGKDPKYRTNMYITDCRIRQNDGCKWTETMKNAAGFLCDRLYTKVFKDFDASPDCWGLFTGDGDRNFMKYSLAMLCTCYAYEDNYAKCVMYEKYAVSRPDGGRFIAHAAATDDCSESPEPNLYWACGYMNTYVEDGAMHKISLDCRFSDRSEMRWRDDLYSDWTALYSFIKSDLDPKAIPAESYKRLCDKGYVHNDRVMVTALIPKDGDDCREALKRVITENVTVSDDISRYGQAGLRTE